MGWVVMGGQDGELSSSCAQLVETLVPLRCTRLLPRRAAAVVLQFGPAAHQQALIPTHLSLTVHTALGSLEIEDLLVGRRCTRNRFLASSVPGGWGGGDVAGRWQGAGRASIH